MNVMTAFARQQGYLPDRYWNQLNGKTASDNYRDFKSKQLENPEDNTAEIHITYEVKMK